MLKCVMNTNGKQNMQGDDTPDENFMSLNFILLIRRNGHNMKIYQLHENVDYVMYYIMMTVLIVSCI